MEREVGVDEYVLNLKSRAKEYAMERQPMVAELGIIPDEEVAKEDDKDDERS